MKRENWLMRKKVLIYMLLAFSLVFNWEDFSFVPFLCAFSILSFQFSSVQSLSHVWLFVTQWAAARQASLSITNYRSLLKLMSIKWVMPSNNLILSFPTSRSLLQLMSTESVMPPNHLILCRPLLFLLSIFPSIRVFSSESALSIRWPLQSPQGTHTTS